MARREPAPPDPCRPGFARLNSCSAPATPEKSAHVGGTDAASAVEFHSKNLWVFRHGLQNADLAFTIGWLSADASTYTVAGIIRDPEGQTYTIIRHENDDCVARRTATKPRRERPGTPKTYAPHMSCSPALRLISDQAHTLEMWLLSNSSLLARIVRPARPAGY